MLEYSAPHPHLNPSPNPAHRGHTEDHVRLEVEGRERVVRAEGGSDGVQAGPRQVA